MRKAAGCLLGCPAARLPGCPAADAQHACPPAPPAALQMQQRNLPANAQRKYLTSFLLNEAVLEAGELDCSLPVEQAGVLLYAPSPSGRRLLVVQAGAGDASAGVPGRGACGGARAVPAALFAWRGLLGATGRSYQGCSKLSSPPPAAAACSAPGVGPQPGGARAACAQVPARRRLQRRLVRHR